MSASTPLKTVLFIGSARAKRIGSVVANQLRALLQSRQHEVTVLDPRETEDGYFMSLVDKAHFHYKPKDGDHAPVELERTAQIIRDADGYVVVSPEYNHQAPPALTNMMSAFGASVYASKPSAIVSYSAGNWGGVRAAVGLRSYLAELGCISVSATLPIAGAWKAFDGDGNFAAEQKLKMANKLLDQYEWHAHAMRNHREAGSQ